VQHVLTAVPTPIGVGPEYHPRPAVHGSCSPAPLFDGPRIHLELFARGRVVVVPAGIGVRGERRSAGRIVAARCRGRIWTLDPSGVVRFARPARLASLFAVWGTALGQARLLGFAGAVRVYVNGALRRGDPRTLPLRDRDQVVLEVGPYVAPHRRFRFPRH
jgi:hypothetical protein